MKHRELIVEIGFELAEPLSDALLALGALSVSIEDADANTPDEQPLFGEPSLAPQHCGWRHSRMIVLLAAEQDPAQLLAQASNALALTDTPTFTIHHVAEQDWVRLTQSQFEPIAVGKRIWIVPSWHTAPSDPNALVLELDPGLAFGTGSHPTTQLCIEWLEQHVNAHASVLDYGCGSGILAIVAAKCGAPRVVGIDIDPQAVEIARQNSLRNHAAVVCELPSDCPSEEFDIVIANILSNPLKWMASLLCARVKPGGQIALSGILARQADEVAQVYQPWIALSVQRECEGWVCLAGRRPERVSKKM